MLTVNPGSPQTPVSYAFNRYFSMPFKTSAGIEVENDSETNAAIWYHIDHVSVDEPPSNIEKLPKAYHRDAKYMLLLVLAELK